MRQGSPRAVHALLSLTRPNRRNLVSVSPITVYWRPGCGFCSSLLRGLERSELGFEQVNIWDDEQGAVFVRSVAGGNETVPTVRIGDEVALVNPSTREVMATVAQHLPEHLPEGYEPPEPGRAGRFLGKLLGA